MTEKPYSECPELPTSDDVAPQRATETPSGRHPAEQKIAKLSLDKIGLIKLVTVTGVLILIAVLLKLLRGTPWIGNIAVSLALTAVCLLIFRLASPPVSCCFMKGKAATWVLVCWARATSSCSCCF
jgi:hypothetical protein